MTGYRLTQYAHGGGCACKIPPGELEAVVAGLVGDAPPGGPGELLVGLDDSVDDPEPKYGMAVTGIADPSRLMRNDAGRPGVPLTLTKPLGIGVLNSRHKATGVVYAQAVDAMATLNRDASVAALAAGATCAT